MAFALTVQNIQKSFGVHQVLTDVSFMLPERARMGLIGRNGCGKSTLLSIIANAQTPDAGHVTLMKNWRMGFLTQLLDFTQDETVWQVLEKIFAPVFAMEQSLRRMEHDMAHAKHEAFDRLAEEYDSLRQSYEENGGYRWRSEVQGVLTGLGFSPPQWEQQASTLSGGEATRLAMARLLLQKPNLLLLDEPTNHLDLQSVAWLESVLQNYAGALLIISHDRYFLDRVCDRIGELQDGRLEVYEGNYSAFIRKRNARHEAEMKAWSLQQTEIKRQEAIIERYRMYNREKSIKAAESREKALNRMEKLDRPELDEHTMALHFTASRRTGDEVLTADGLSMAYGEKQIFENVDLQLRAGDRVVLIGANGIGKSTLLRMLAGENDSDDSNNMRRGAVRYGSNVDLGYYDQHNMGLNQEKTVLDEVWDAFPKMLQTEVRGALGAFLFRNDEVFQPISTLSGGERARVALTKLMLACDNLLLLDEPTNHLDILSKERLEEALSDYNGTLLCISHDRYFMNRVAQKIWVMDSDGLTEYLGNYDDYIAKRGQLEDWAAEDTPPAPTRTAVREERRKEREAREERKRKKQAAAEWEAQIARLEQEIADLEAQLCDPEVYQSSETAKEITARHRAAGIELEQAYEEWELALGEKSDL